MNRFLLSILRLLFILIILFGLTGGLTTSVQAATCTWSGTTTDWYEVNNWSNCLDISLNPKVPGPGDAVIISAGASSYPVLTIYQDNIFVDSLTILAGGMLTIDEQTSIHASQFDNWGTIAIAEVTGHNLHIYSPFNNYSTVNIGSEASLILHDIGNHSGSFTGRQLSLNDSIPPFENTFGSGSSIDVNVMYIGDNRTATINGSFNCLNDFYIDPGALADLSSATIINLGTLHIRDGGQLVTSGRPINISESTSLTGNGTIEANVTNGGLISPGESPGKITIDGNYTQTSSGVLEIELWGTTPVTGYDQLAITGLATIGGDLKVTTSNSFTPVLGQSFAILTYGSFSDEFAYVDLPSLPDGLVWTLQYTDTELLLTVSTLGSISGSVSCVGEYQDSTATVSMALFVSNPNSSPAESMEISCGGSYLFDDLPNATYYVSAFLDFNNSGGPPDPNEPFAWYGDPDELSITNGEDFVGVDITIGSPWVETFIPLVTH